MLTKRQRANLLIKLGERFGFNTYSPPSFEYYCPPPNGPGPGPFHNWYFEGYYLHQLVESIGIKWTGVPFPIMDGSPKTGDKILLFLDKLIKEHDAKNHISLININEIKYDKNFDVDYLNQ